MLRSFHYAAYAPLLASTGTVKVNESNQENLNRLGGSMGEMGERSIIWKNI